MDGLGRFAVASHLPFWLLRQQSSRSIPSPISGAKERPGEPHPPLPPSSSPKALRRFLGFGALLVRKRRRSLWLQRPTTSDVACWLLFPFLFYIPDPSRCPISFHLFRLRRWNEKWRAAVAACRVERGRDLGGRHPPTEGTLSSHTGV